MNKRIITIGLIIIGSLLLIWGGSKLFYYKNREKDKLTLYGNVDIRDVMLSFRVSGRIARMHFEEGDSVKKGVVIATLDKDTFQNDLALAKAELLQAEAAGKNAEQVYLRRSKLIKTGAVSKALYDEAVSNRNQAKALIAIAKARIKRAKIALSDTEILAPVDGIILTRVLEKGAIVQSGQAVYSLALDRPIWIRTYIDEPSLGYIYNGKKATITTDSGGKYQGQVGFISPQAEFTPKNVETTQLRTDLVYRLRVIIDNPDKGLRQGMPVTVHIESD